MDRKRGFIPVLIAAATIGFDFMENAFTPRADWKPEPRRHRGKPTKWFVRAESIANWPHTQARLKAQRHAIKRLAYCAKRGTSPAELAQRQLERRAKKAGK